MYQLMKLIILILLLISENTFACIPSVTTKPTLSFIVEPVFLKEIDSNSQRARVKAILHLSASGKVLKISHLEVEPANLPKEPILRAIRHAKFIPGMMNERRIEVEDYEFVWEFELNKKLSINLD